jgi:S-adenosylmethionine uptake transporter
MIAAACRRLLCRSDGLAFAHVTWARMAGHCKAMPQSAESSAMNDSTTGSARSTVALGVVLSFLTYATYALSDASVRLLHGSVPSFELVFFGSVLGLLAIPMVRKPGERWGDLLRCNNRWMWSLRALAAVAGALFSVIAFTALPMAEAFALIFLLPAFVTILSVIFLHEPVGWRRWSAVVAGFIGVLIVLRPGFRALGIGHLAAIASGFAGAVTIIVLRKLGPTETRISLYGAGLIGPIVISFIVMLPHFTMPNERGWLLILAYGLLGGIGNVLLMLASAMAPASLVAPPQYSQMLWGIGLGYFIFSDHLDAPMFIGAAVIIAAGLFTLSRESVRKPRWWNRSPPIHPQ